MSRISIRFRTLIAVAALAAAAMLIGACGDDNAEEAAPTNDVSSGICADGATDCDDTADQNDASAGATAAASPQRCSDPASCEEQSTTLARRDLAAQLGVEVDAIVIVSAEAVDWPDACLGAAEPGTVCAQVITPGFKITLENSGTEYKYHTNHGTRAVLVP